MNNLRLTSFIIVNLFFLFFLISFPYFFAHKNCLPEKHFLGQIEYMPDQDMYFSFINQAHNGKILFNNKLTYLENKNVFFNVQFALIGLLQKTFGISSNSTYQLWRFIGIICLMLSFYFLANLVFKSKKKQMLSLFVFCFGGGFSFLFLPLFMAGVINRDSLYLLSIDLWSGIIPFQQMITNPHFSLPHGVFLFGMFLFLAAEKKSSIPLYILSGILFTLQGFIRPYDLISISALISVFIILEALINGFDKKIIFLRLIPLLIIIPAFIYNIWLFKINSIFKYWSLQGHNAGSDPMFLFQYLSYGIAGILALVRIWFINRQPLNKTDRFLLCWFVVVFFLCHIGKIIPILGFSPQLGVPLFGPLVLFSLGIEATALRFKKNIIRLGSLFLVLITICYSISTTFYFSQRYGKGKTDNENYYASVNEFRAWQWINRNISADKVCLALPDNALRIVKYSKVQVPAAHYSVTPRFTEVASQVNMFFNDKTDNTVKLELIKSLNIEYVYIGPKEAKSIGDISFLSIYGVPIFQNDEVKIYHVSAHPSSS